MAVGISISQHYHKTNHPRKPGCLHMPLNRFTMRKKANELCVKSSMYVYFVSFCSVKLQQQGSTDLIFRRFFLISLRNVCEHFKWYFLQNRFNIGRFFLSFGLRLKYVSSASVCCRGTHFGKYVWQILFFIVVPG